MRIQTTFALVPIAIVLGGFAITGCPGSLDDPNKFLDGGSTGGDCLDIETELFQVEGNQDTPGCAGVGCHDADQDQIDLVSPGVKTRLTGMAVGASCPGEIVVADPSDPEGSLLYDKVSSTSPTCGNKMPLVGAPLTDEQLACLAEYIGTLEGGGSPAGSGGSSNGGSGSGGEATGGDGSGGSAGGT